MTIRASDWPGPSRDTSQRNLFRMMPRNQSHYPIFGNDSIDLPYTIQEAERSFDRPAPLIRASDQKRKP